MSALALLIAGCQEPPVRELQEARQTMEQAKREGAPDVAPDLYSLAESELTVGEEEIQAQAEKIFWQRDYSLASRLVSLAQADARKALLLARETRLKPAPDSSSAPPPHSISAKAPDFPG